MAKKEAAPSTGKKEASGTRARAGKNRQLKLCRRKIKQFEAKKRFERLARIKVHMSYIEKGESPPRNEERRQARQAHEGRMAAKQQAANVRQVPAPVPKQAE
jgi:hypothetical protein